MKIRYCSAANCRSTYKNSYTIFRQTQQLLQYLAETKMNHRKLRHRSSVDIERNVLSNKSRNVFFKMKRRSAKRGECVLSLARMLGTHSFISYIMKIYSIFIFFQDTFPSTSTKFLVDVPTLENDRHRNMNNSRKYFLFAHCQLHSQTASKWTISPLWRQAWKNIRAHSYTVSGLQVTRGKLQSHKPKHIMSKKNVTSRKSYQLSKRIVHRQRFTQCLYIQCAPLICSHKCLPEIENVVFFGEREHYVLEHRVVRGDFHTITRCKIRG